MRLLRPLPCVVMLPVLLLQAAPAAARTSLFLGFGTAFYPPPPAYYYVPPPPPAYYYVPPPAHPYPGYGYVPPPALTGESCRAGAWTCPLAAPARIGDACSCPTPRGPAWGRVGG